MIRRAFLLLLLRCLAFVYSSTANSGSVLCVDGERQALLRFKQDLIVPSNRLSSWTASHSDCCNWDEVVCHNFTGHVKELHLNNPYDRDAAYRNFESSKLRGKINPSLLDLKYLDYLDLSGNDFRGIPIPNFFGSMVSLTYLNLSEAGFQGLIPRQLGKLSNLRVLSIRGEWIFDDYGIARLILYVENLHWLTNLSSLLHLDFQKVNLSAASHEWLGVLNSFPSLLELHLSHCQLAFLPSLSTVNFTSLSALDFSRNNFYKMDTSMLKWVLSLSKLRSLDLSFNGFTGPIPNGMSNLSSLTILNLASNRFTSPLPDWLFGLGSLISLSLSGNNFHDPIPISFQNLTSLRNLELSGAAFPNDTIPDWVYNFPHLESLDISYADLRGQISSSIQNLTSLATLDLSNNELVGTIPKTLTSLCSLRHIELQGNQLGGQISKALEGISGCSSRILQSVILSNNFFSGSLPNSLQSLSSLIMLDLSYNQMVGNIPQSLGTPFLELLYFHDNRLNGIFSEVHFRNLTNLRSFSASNNNITLKVDSNWVPPFHLEVLDLGCWNIGPQFPLWLKYQHDLSDLDLSSTGISDPIPSWFWNLFSRLQYLDLSDNEIDGELPSPLGVETESTGFLGIFLSSNKFSGPLPRISGNVSVLDLSNNSFLGSVSALLCNPMTQVNQLLKLNLGENNLSGEIPDCWMHWTSLTVISLGNNNLSGKLPASIAYLSNLQSLHLRNNNLIGEIPASLQNCSGLKFLDLGFNDFVGKISEWLGSLHDLIVLALPSNNLQGKIPSKFCHLISLQILDLAGNNLSGSIPTCINNLTALSAVPQSVVARIFEGYFSSFIENAFVVMKGREAKYDTILLLLRSMDFSRNKLSGDIPSEITTLLGLRSLNLSGNKLTGEIPIKIGDMQVLESFDLSRNQISGRIPPSMSSMHFLSYLNLSSNNLSGEIPLSTQLQSFSSSSFGGNRLCGPPLTVTCSNHALPPESNKERQNKGGGVNIEGFYVAVVVGFVVGFWGICGPLLYSRSWRTSYYSFLNTAWCKICVKWQLMRRAHHRGQRGKFR